jgi:hypothetical protein
MFAFEFEFSCKFEYFLLYILGLNIHSNIVKEHNGHLGIQPSSNLSLQKTSFFYEGMSSIHGILKLYVCVSLLGQVSLLFVVSDKIKPEEPKKRRILKY